MVRTTMIAGSLVVIIALAACGGGQVDTGGALGETGEPARAAGTPRAGLPDDFEMPLSMRLPVGTLMLEETAYAVTPEQAEVLLPLWQMLRALQESSTSSQVEVEAVYTQIQETMTPDQLAAIEEMSSEDTRALFEELGMGRRGDAESDEGQRGGFGPPDGAVMIMPPGGGEGGPGIGPGGFGAIDPEARATIVAGRGGMGMGSGTGMTDAVIELLETRVAGL